MRAHTPTSTSCAYLGTEFLGRRTRKRVRRPTRRAGGVAPHQAAGVEIGLDDGRGHGAIALAVTARGPRPLVLRQQGGESLHRGGAVLERVERPKDAGILGVIGLP